MDLQFSAAETEFRAEVGTWLREHAPTEPRPVEGLAMREFDLAWQRAQYRGGWAGISWPVEYGGRGLSLTEQLIWYEEYGLAGAPPAGCCFVGLNHGGPTLIVEGTEDHKQEHLLPILKGEVVWCQGFSEPGAGSDLAGIATRGTVDGDELVVNGQKIWTSFADVADCQELLVRTGSGPRRQDGLTWIICEMQRSGIEVRPLRTMAGNTEYCEVFYDDVRIPLSNVVGELGDGWRVAMSTLSFERGTAYLAEQVRLANDVERLFDMAESLPGPDGRRPAIADDHVAARLGAARAEVAALRALTYVAISRWRRTNKPGVEGSVLRLFHAELLQRVYRLGMDLLGWEALGVAAADFEQSWARNYLDSYASTIVGGTSDIQRNIIGERLLGLPRDRA
jgi:alkylation response protein AidB-like acyl-CoA dehydrogenase